MVALACAFALERTSAHQNRGEGRVVAPELFLAGYRRLETIRGLPFVFGLVGAVVIDHRPFISLMMNALMCVNLSNNSAVVKIAKMLS